MKVSTRDTLTPLNKAVHLIIVYVRLHMVFVLDTTRFSFLMELSPPNIKQFEITVDFLSV